MSQTSAASLFPFYRGADRGSEGFRGVGWANASSDSNATSPHRAPHARRRPLLSSSSFTLRAAQPLLSPSRVLANPTVSPVTAGPTSALCFLWGQMVPQARPTPAYGCGVSRSRPPGHLSHLLLQVPCGPHTLGHPPWSRLPTWPKSPAPHGLPSCDSSANE